MRYRIDRTWRRHPHATGDTVVAGSPMRIFRFTQSAATLLRTLESEGEVDASTEALRARLVAAGAIHPIPEPTDHPIPTLDDVTVVIPARVEDASPLRDLVESLPRVAATVVVDDGSPTPIADIGRARIVRNETPRGPAGARNAALASVTTEFVLFLDHDISLPADAANSDFWFPLLFHMHEPPTALVAPRVRSCDGSTFLQRYETECSPLDMGRDPALVRPGSRVPYVPSAALLVRTSTLGTLHGFDETLRYGEDVDLVWRAADSGFVCRYEPTVVIEHEPRSTWRDLLEQRFRYGTAAAPLERRHPGSTRPVRSNLWSAVVVGLALCGRPILAAMVAVGTAVRLARRLSKIPNSWRVAFRLAGRGHLFAVNSTLKAAVRTWWPITAVLCIVSKRTRTVIGGFVLADGLRTWIERTRSKRETATLDPIRTTIARLADDVAYGSGVWVGALRARDPACLAPRLDR